MTAYDSDRQPISWPALTSEEAAEEWKALRIWVSTLMTRFPNAIRLPECWWQHNDLVEVLAALRDHERACFASSAPATAAVEWQRALRDMEPRIDVWIKRFSCNVPGRPHGTPRDVGPAPAGWTDFVEDDVQRRRRLLPQD